MKKELPMIPSVLYFGALGLLSIVTIQRTINNKFKYVRLLDF